MVFVLIVDVWVVSVVEVVGRSMMATTMLVSVSGCGGPGVVVGEEELGGGGGMEPVVGVGGGLVSMVSKKTTKIAGEVSA